MPDPFMALFGGLVVATALTLWMALNRPGRSGARAGLGTTPDRPAGVRRRWELAGCVVLAAVGLDLAVSHGVGTSSPDGGGITLELGIAMIVLAVVWSIFRKEVLGWQLRLGTALYDLPKPPDAAQVKAAEYTGTFLRLLLVVLGFIIVAAGLTLR